MRSARLPVRDVLPTRETWPWWLGGATLTAAVTGLGFIGGDPLHTALLLTGLLVICMITMINTNAAVVILIFSMLLSPELTVAQAPSRQVVVRVDDFLLMAIVFTWLAKTALQQDLGVLRWTPLHGPMLLFVVWLIAATLLAVLNGELPSPKQSVFYLIKYFEYFLVFFLGVNVLRTKRQVDLFWRALILTALCVGIYGWWTRGNSMRISAPFEGDHPEPNTLAGYLVLIMGVLLGRAAFATTTVRCLQLLGMTAFLFVPFLGTLSRGGYTAFLVMYVALLLLMPRRKGWFALPLIFLLVAGPIVFPEVVVERIRSTFEGSMMFGSVGERLGLDPSAAQRVDIWFWTFDQLRKHPFVGYGVAGLGLIDQQYCLVLAEAGAIGGVLYLWTRWVIWRTGWQSYRQVTDPEQRGLVLGYLCAYLGLLVHSFAGNIFIIVRIMEPFWFLTAMVAALPHLDAAPAVAATAPRAFPPPRTA